MSTFQEMSLWFLIKEKNCSPVIIFILLFLASNNLGDVSNVSKKLIKMSTLWLRCGEYVSSLILIISITSLCLSVSVMPISDIVKCLVFGGLGKSSECIRSYKQLIFTTLFSHHGVITISPLNGLNQRIQW